MLATCHSSSQAGQPSTCREITQAQETDSFNLLLSKEAKGSSQEEGRIGETSIHAENNMFQSNGSAEQTGKVFVSVVS